MTIERIVTIEIKDRIGVEKMIETKEMKEKGDKIENLIMIDRGGLENLKGDMTTKMIEQI